jgi:2-polyprenyl-3-methyl-5-hydroxy-6-metoxy-1,4-benzoquinol methylase
MAEKHFYEQKQFTKEYLIPFFMKYVPDFHSKKILEVGCAEGGLIESMQEIGIYAVGIELSPERAAIAKEKNPKLNVFVGDITDPDLPNHLKDKFDLIIMREVIEHVPDKNAAFDNLVRLATADGFIFISFPPKYSPFAGHQQIGKTFLKAIPYLHLLPGRFLKMVAKSLGEDDSYINEIKHHFQTGCSIKEFEKQCSEHNLNTVKKEFFFFRPIYALRFGIRTIRLPNIPLLRENISFGCETLLRKKGI